MQQQPNGGISTSVDWGRFGLGGGGGGSNRGEETVHFSRNEYPSIRNNNSFDSSPNSGYGRGGHQATDPNELFAQEQNYNPWWKSNFFISQPVLFGTWDGVFTSCLINIFGVIVFLRSGWLVAEAGILSAVAVVIFTVSIALISVLAAVGICERCRIESGGVYFLLSHILGSKFGGAIGLLYVFGQSVGSALNVLGFGESLAGLVGIESEWAMRGFACLAILLLGIINIAGVKWVIKLQFLLLLILLLAGLDFAVGSFVHTDYEHGFEGWFTGNIGLNAFSEYTEGYSWFICFGVFFPTITGVMAGINMSGDLKNPSKEIPNGSLAAIGTGTGLYLIFILFLGATCRRDVLLNDYMIAEKVSAISVLLLAGLYVSSMSSGLAAMYGTPRVLQSIAAENVIPGIGFLATGRGPNKVPVYSMAVVALITVTFILVGKINTLAPVVTMPFLLTYATIDYAYFALAQTHDIEHRREARFHKPSNANKSSYGAVNPQTNTSTPSGDLDFLFPERTRHRNLTRTPSTPSDVVTPEGNQEGEIIGEETVQRTPIHNKTNNWYSTLCNRWISLIGAVLKLLIMLLVHWEYALANFLVCFLIWLYVGQVNPAVKPGRAAEFKFFSWLKTCILRLCGRRVQEYEQIVVTPQHPGLDVSSSQLNDDNEDFSSRKPYHQTSTVEGVFVNVN